jgi:uncharacterized protein with PIN domain
MVIDTSVLLAILQDEPECRAFAEAIENAGSCSMSVATLLETSPVIESRFGAEGSRLLDQLVEKAKGGIRLHRAYPSGTSAIEVPARIGSITRRTLGSRSLSATLSRWGLRCLAPRRE